MDKGFWTAVEEFIGQRAIPVRIPLVALRLHLQSHGMDVANEFIEALLVEDSQAAEPNLRWTVTKESDGKLRFTPR